MKFDEIDWHDQIIQHIKVDRTDAGNSDIIELNVIINENHFIVRYSDVYYAELKLNFGIIAEESIRYAIENNEDNELQNIKNKWDRFDSKVNALKCFEFNTNSTNSLIKIYALSCEIHLASS